MKKHTNKPGIIIFIIIIFLAVFAVAWTVFSSSRSNSSCGETKKTFPEQKDSSGTIINFLDFNKPKKAGKSFGKSYIAALYIQGTIEDKNKIYNQEWLLDKIDDLTNDQNNNAIMLFINSPGGGVYQADEVYLALLDYKQETGRPVYAYMGSMAASGGYYIACAADKLCANRNTLTGSIGVIAGESVDITALLENIGIKTKTIHSGKNKNMFNFNEPLTDEQEKIMQAVADEAYDQFTGIVAESRKMKIEDVKGLADGRIYTAKQALDNGLIDNICSWDDAIKTLEHDYFKDEKCTLRHFEYEEKESVYDMFMGAFSAITGPKASLPFSALEAKALESISPDLPYPAYYYTGK